MALNVGELQATLGINTKGFTSGIKSAQNELDGFNGKLENGVKRAADGASDGMKDAANASNDLGDSLELTAEQADETAQAIKNVGEESKKADNKAGNAKETFGKFKQLLGTLGVGFSVGAIINAIQQVIDKVKEASNEVDKLDTNLQYLTGLYGTDAERLTSMIPKIATDIPVKDLNDISYALATVSKFDGVDTDAQILSITEDLLALKLIFSNIDVSATGSDLNDMFVKWGVSVEDYTTRMAQLRQISQDTLIPFDQLVSGMSDMDGLAETLGVSMEELMGIISTMRSKSEFDDFVSGAKQMTDEVISRIEGFNQTASTLGNVRSNIEASKTNTGDWTAEQTKWQTDNIVKMQDSTSQIAERADDIAKVQNDLVKQGYTLNTELQASNQIVKDELHKANDEIQSSDLPTIAQNMAYLLTTANDIKTDFQESIFSLFKRDTAPIVQVTVEGISDQYKVTTEAQQSAVASVNNPTYGGY